MFLERGGRSSYFPHQAIQQKSPRSGMQGRLIDVQKLDRLRKEGRVTEIAESLLVLRRQDPVVCDRYVSLIQLQSSPPHDTTAYAI